MTKLWQGLLLGLVLGSGGMALAQQAKPIVIPGNGGTSQLAQLQQQVTTDGQNIALLTNQLLVLQKNTAAQNIALTSRIAALEQRFNTHTHAYTYEHLNYGNVDAGGAQASRINGNQMNKATTSPPN